MNEPIATINLDDDPSVASLAGQAAADISVQRIWLDPLPYITESGVTLPTVQVAYETWGTLNAAGDNGVYVCHALTGDSHAAGVYAGESRAGWWDALIGPGRALDTDRYFVVCANILGGCQGTTGPTSPAANGLAYGSRFPTVTVRDMVRLEYRLLVALGVQRLACVIGGSLGGMQVAEWLVCYPDFVAAAVPIAASFAHSPQGIAFSLIGRRAIEIDPDWQGGDYYGTGRSPEQGLALARMVGMISYQSDESMRRKFGRERVEADPASYYQPASRFQVENYLYYQGAQLVRRFDANSYLVLTRAMDLHDVARGRGDLAAGLARVTARTLVLGINSDLLFPTRLQQEMAAALQLAGKAVQYVELDSPWGHDAFLIEHQQLTAILRPFLAAG